MYRNLGYIDSLNSTWLVSTRLDMHFGCVELVEQHGSTHSTRRARLARHVRHDERDRRDSQLSLLCNLYKVMLCKLFTNLLEYTLI